MRNKIFFTLASVFVTTQIVFGDSGQHHIRLSEHPWFKDRLPRVLQCLVINEAKRNSNHFFVSDIFVDKNCDFSNSPTGCLSANKMMPHVLWEESREIILFEPMIKEAPFTDLLYSRRRWVYGRDTVKTENEMNGSNFLMTDTFWKNLEKQAKAGITYSINKSDLGKMSTSCENG